MYKVEIAFGRGLRMELKSRDIVLVVSNEDRKMGELRISRGSVDWWGYMNKATPTTLTWERFAEVMEDPSLPRRRKVRRPVKAKRAS
ncbi:MAG: hypothetical protein M3082_11070 [Candidatus Dormibacteraeota bacterium]|jgi:hypothetical protein|nr:hypothetical protein [Candidatus Dormibacteraeota bacterium]